MLQDFDTPHLHQSMVEVLCRVTSVDAKLNKNRFAKFARELLNASYTPIQVECWYSHPDQMEAVTQRYGTESVRTVDNFGWFYHNHWAYIKNKQLPNQAFVRETILLAKEGEPTFLENSPVQQQTTEESDRNIFLEDLAYLKEIYRLEDLQKPNDFPELPD